LIGTAKRELDIGDRFLKAFQGITMSYNWCKMKGVMGGSYCKRYCIPERGYKLNFAQQEDFASAYLLAIQSGGTR
jgi:hypothetical protein